MHFLLLLGVSFFAIESAAPDTIVVCPSKMQESIQRWVKYREKQGHKIVVVAPEKSAKATQTVIRRYAQQGNIKHVVLVGDCVFDEGQIRQRGMLTPTFYEVAKVNVKFGSQKTIATDNPYADLDGDKLPELTVGRLAVDTNKQLSTLIDKIIRYEASQDFSQWRRRVNFVAGVGGFGVLEDSVLETATKCFISNRIPHCYKTSMTYASWRSPYCPDPRKFHDMTVDRFNEGCLFWVYIGHGLPLQLDKVNLSGIGYHILDVNDMPRISAKHGSPIAIFLACHTAAFDLSRDCMAEEMLRLPKGPIAVLGGTRVTLPYSMSVLSHEMLNEYFRGDAITLGEVIKRAKRKSMNKEVQADVTTRRALDAVASIVSPTGGLLKHERKECLSVFNLIGDPLIRVKRPEKIELEFNKTAKAGTKIEIIGHAPTAGELIVELSYPRKRQTIKTPRRDEIIWTTAEFDKYQRTYEKANKRELVTNQTTLKSAGQFKVEMPIPPNVRGEFNVRAYLNSKERFAMGSREIKIR